jgi:hypothetical protein
MVRVSLQIGAGIFLDRKPGGNALKKTLSKVTLHLPALECLSRGAGTQFPPLVLPAVRPCS